MFSYAKSWVTNNIFNAHLFGTQPALPRGVYLYYIKRKRGQLHQEGRLSIKSKWRTGAAIRSALMEEVNKPVTIFTKRHRPSFFKDYFLGEGYD